MASAESYWLVSRSPELPDWGNEIFLQHSLEPPQRQQEEGAVLPPGGPWTQAAKPPEGEWSQGLPKVFLFRNKEQRQCIHDGCISSSKALWGTPLQGVTLNFLAAFSVPSACTLSPCSAVLLLQILLVDLQRSFIRAQTLRNSWFPWPLVMGFSLLHVKTDGCKVEMLSLPL